jgi:peptidoglycan-associated lipoprotein
MRFSATPRFFTQRSAARVYVLMAALLLAACGSSVDLNPQAAAPVDNRTGSNATTQSGAASGGNVAGNALGNAAGNSGSSASSASSSSPGAGNLINVVYFDFDSAQIRPEFKNGIEAQAQFLNADRTRRLKLEGHTDERGGSEYNLALGQQRAEAVRRSLSVLGVSETQMEAVSYGKEKLASMGADETAHAANRRVELSR